MKKHLKSTLAILLAVVLIAVAVPFGAFARTVETAPVTFGVMSDTHYYPRSLMPADGDEQGWETFNEFCRVKGKQFPQPARVNHRPRRARLQQQVGMIRKGHATCFRCVKQALFAHTVAREDQLVPVAVDDCRQYRTLYVLIITIAPAPVGGQHDARQRALLAHQPQFPGQCRGVAHAPLRTGKHALLCGRVACGQRVRALFSVWRVAQAARFHMRPLVENAQKFHIRSPFGRFVSGIAPCHPMKCRETECGPRSQRGPQVLRYCTRLGREYNCFFRA